MPFHFPLAAVLRAREMVEESEERTLQTILFAIAKVIEDIARIDARIQEAEALRHAEALKPCLGLHLHAAYGEVRQLRERRKDCEAQLPGLHAARDTQLMVFDSARRDRETLSDMREKKRSAYEAEATKRAQNALDDNYIARRGRF